MTAEKQDQSQAPAQQVFDPRKRVDSGSGPPRKVPIPLAILQNSTRPKIKPVPGVPPHLWHLHQGGRAVTKDPTGKVVDLSKTSNPATTAQSVQQQPKGQAGVTSSPEQSKGSAWGNNLQANSSKQSTGESAYRTEGGPQATRTGHSAGAGSQSSNTCPHLLKGDQAVFHQGDTPANPWSTEKKPWQAEKKPWQARQAQKKPWAANEKPRVTERGPGAGEKRGTAAPPPHLRTVFSPWPSQHCRPPPPPAEVIKHDLPVRRHDWTGSQRSPVAVSDLHFSDGPEEAKEVNPQISPDIRNEIGVEVPMYRYNNDMGEPRIRFGHFGEYVDYDTGLCTEEFVYGMVEAWIQNVTVNAKVSFKYRPDHFKCDINTETGGFLGPLTHPETRPRVPKDPELKWRQMNWTSEILRRRKFMRPRVEPPRPPPGVQPLVPCHLRPAEASDMEAVAAIYNSEAIQKFDSAPLGASDFKKILINTHGHEYPFIVAISGSARVDALKDGIRFESSQPQRKVLPPDLKEGVVLGFAYLSVWRPGLTGSYTGTGRAALEAHVFVHTSWRHRKIGSALLDRLLASVSLDAKSKDMCDFWDPSRNPAYAAPCQHERYTYKIYMQYLVQTKFNIKEGVWEVQENKDDVAWVKNLLETKFGFKEKVRFEAAYRSPKIEGGGANHWLDAVVFEHICCSPSWIDHLY